MGHSGPTDRLLIEPWILALRSVDHKLDAVALNKIDYIGAAFFDLINAFYFETGIFQNAGSLMRVDDIESQFCETMFKLDETAFIIIGNADEHDSIRGLCLACVKQGF